MTRHVAIDGACWWNDRGFGRFTRELVRALAARTSESGFQYTLFLERDNPASGLFPEPPSQVRVEIVGTPSSRASMSGAGARTPLHMLKMGRALAAARPDLIFFPAIYSWVPVPSRAPSIVTIHDAIPERFPRLIFPTRTNELLWRAKSKASRALSSRVLTVSKASAREITELLGVPPNRIDITSEAADAIFRRRDPVSRSETLVKVGLEDGPFLLYVGGFNAHKNVLVLLEAFASLEAPIRLVLVGDTSGKGFHDDIPAIRRWIDTRPELANRVALPGWLTDDELVNLYSTASTLLMPSLSEGFGLPAIEAMSCGCPVICSNRTSLPEVVGDAGLLVEPTDSAAIARAVRSVLTDKTLAKNLRAAGQARAATFTWERGARLTEVSFHAALQGRT